VTSFFGRGVHCACLLLISGELCAGPTQNILAGSEASKAQQEPAAICHARELQVSDDAPGPPQRTALSGDSSGDVLLRWSAQQVCNFRSGNIDFEKLACQAPESEGRVSRWQQLSD